MPENSLLILKLLMDTVGGSCSKSAKFEVSSTPLTTGTKGGTAENQEEVILVC
jgi:hypothetical protein